MTGVRLTRGDKGRNPFGNGAGNFATEAQRMFHKMLSLSIPEKLRPQAFWRVRWGSARLSQTFGAFKSKGLAMEWLC